MDHAVHLTRLSEMRYSAGASDSPCLLCLMLTAWKQIHRRGAIKHRSTEGRSFRAPGPIRSNIHNAESPTNSFESYYHYHDSLRPDKAECSILTNEA